MDESSDEKYIENLGDKQEDANGEIGEMHGLKNESKKMLEEEQRLESD